MFGTLESPCGEGDASGATQLGVTDTSITIGYGDDAGYQASPGLSHELSDAMRAMIDWCNEQGGINGRELALTQYDAAFTEYTARMGEACDQELAMVGGGIAIRVLRSTMFTFNLAKGDEGWNFTMNSGWLF